MNCFTGGVIISSSFYNPDKDTGIQRSWKTFLKLHSPLAVEWNVT